MATGEPFYLDPTFWVGASFVTFVGGIIVGKGHKKIAGMLDGRSDAIAKQINEASALRDEAEKLLAEYQRKQRDAEDDAKAIVAQAREDAKIITEAAVADVDVMIKRRTRVAGEKIAQAEVNAVKAVKSAAVDVAINAARTVLADDKKATKGLIKDAIAEVESKLH